MILAISTSRNMEDGHCQAANLCVSKEVYLLLSLVSAPRSLPAKSMNDTFPIGVTSKESPLFAGCWYCFSTNCRIQWLLEESALAPVHPVLRFSLLTSKSSFICGTCITAVDLPSCYVNSPLKSTVSANTPLYPDDIAFKFLEFAVCFVIQIAVGLMRMAKLLSSHQIGCLLAALHRSCWETHCISDDLLQANNLDCFFAIFSSFKALPIVEQVVQLPAIDFKAADPQLKAVVLGICQ